MRCAPASLRLEHVAPEVHLTEDAADRVRFVAPARVRERVDGIARGVEAAVAVRAGNGVGRQRRREWIVLAPALGHEGSLVRPDEVV